jgi:hypothetical protein
LKDRGVSSVQFLLASGLSLLLFLALANLVVVQYGRGAIRSALDQGVRVGAISSSAEQCEERMEDVLAQLLGGRMGDEVTVSCQIGAVAVSANAEADFVAWTPFTPDFHTELSAQASRELPP